MIKKMTKYTFVVMNSEVETFLARLQELGVGYNPQQQAG